jgi:hypothetical protein
MNSPNITTVPGFGPTQFGKTKVVLYNLTSGEEVITLYIDPNLLLITEGQILEPNSPLIK